MHYFKYEQKKRSKFTSPNIKFENFILINAKIKTLRKQERNIDFDSEAERYLQNRCVINDKELTFEKIWKIQLCFL